MGPRGSNRQRPMGDSLDAQIMRIGTHRLLLQWIFLFE
jgi:hypothetical protein